MKTYTIPRFPKYIIKFKKVFRKAYKTKSKSCKFQYRNEREIRQIEKGNKKGYWLVKNNKRYFVSCKKLKEIVKLKNKL
jgi:hypothetical protein